MKTVGIAAEYNPFHRGHACQLSACRRMLGEDAVFAAVMSGDFVQRGEAAMFSKFARAEAACRAGIDLVVELPLPWSLASAEGFAAGAVSLMQALQADARPMPSPSGPKPTTRRNWRNWRSFSAAPAFMSRSASG